MVRICVGSLPGHAHQILQDSRGVQHLLYGIRAQEVVVYAFQLLGVLAPVPLGPLLRITYRSHTAQVHAGEDIGSILLLDQIRKRKIRRILMRDMTSHDEGEGPDLRRPQQI